MDFGGALAALKAGKRVQRSGWNGKRMWLVLVEQNRGGLIYGGPPDPRPRYNVTEARGLDLLPWIGMKTADEKFVPWLASHSDMLGEDWQEVVLLEEVLLRARSEVPAGTYISCKLEHHREGEELFVVEHRISLAEDWPASKTFSSLDDGLVRMTKAVVDEVRPELAREFLLLFRRGQ